MIRQQAPENFQSRSGAEAAKPENILTLFEQITGRKATAQDFIGHGPL